jgi:hypothetical protein
MLLQAQASGELKFLRSDREFTMHRVWLRRRFALLLASVMALTWLMAPAAPASAATASISGRVASAATGVGVAGAEVTVWISTLETHHAIKTVISDADGNYTVDQLSAQYYSVEVKASGYLDGWWGSPTPRGWTEIGVGATTVVTGIDVALAKPGSMSGRVIDSAGGAVPGVLVCGETTRSALARWNRCISTDGTGAYQLEQLHPGTVILSMNDAAGRIFHTDGGGVTNRAAATPIVLADGGTLTGKDIVLTYVPAKVTIQVTNAAGAPISGAAVTWARLSGEWPESFKATEKTPGVYTILLAPGSYRLRVGWYWLEYRSEYYQDAYQEKAAKVISLTSGESRDFDITLGRYASVTGAVYGADRKPVSGVEVCVNMTPRDDNWLIECSNTNAAGVYTLSTLTPGLATVWVRTNDFDFYYAGPTKNTVNEKKAAKLAVKAEAKLVGINFHLNRGAVTGVRPKVAGSATVGKTLTAKVGTWRPGWVRFSYQWYAGGKRIAGATKRKLVVGAAQGGNKLTVRVTGTQVGYRKLIKTSAPTAKVRRGKLSAVTPKLAGVAKKGQTLIVDVGTWRPASVKVSLQWLRDGKPIPGATGPQYQLAQAEVGHRICVKVTGRQAGYRVVSKVSARTRLVGG